MIAIPTKEKGLYFVLNPDNGQWIYTNKPDIYKERVIGDLRLRPLKGTEQVLLNVGRACNLRCKYCFVGDKKEETKNMTFDIAKKALYRISQMKNGVKQIIFHGSEPLLNYPLIKKIVEYGKKFDEKIKYSVQTNGTLLTKEKIDFFVKNDVYVGISLDGIKECHNQMRPFQDGKGSFDIIINNLARLQLQQKITSFITVITKYNVEELGNIVELGKKLKIKTISLNPVLSDNPSITPNDNSLTENLIKVTDRYLDDLENGIETPSLDHVKRYVSLLLNTDKYTNSCLICEAGPTNPLLAIDVNGIIYPCDHFWDESKFAIGHIDDMSLDEASRSKRNFRNDIEFKIDKECFECDWKNICSGGCPGGRLINNKAQYCETTKEMLKYFVERIPVLKENGLLKKIMYRN